jgi:protein arginine N-methyltransferase 2
MRELGWYDREGVKIIEGKWQDVTKDELNKLGRFDIVYTDTFSEHYEGAIT